VDALSIEKAKEIIDYTFAFWKEGKGLFQLTWERVNFRQPMCSAFFGNSVLRMKK
jgi:hypothetical protein